MKKLISWIAGGSETAEKLADAAIKSGDALIYTDEEKSKTAERQRDLYFRFLELSRDESSIKSITRRVLAFAVIGQWLALINLAAGLGVWGALAETKQPAEAALFVFGLIQDMFWFVFAVGTFYFGAGIINQVSKGAGGGRKDGAGREI